VELFGEKPDFNPFKNNNNQIEKSPKKQKENNMECKYEPKSKLFYFTAFPSLNIRAQMQFQQNSESPAPL